MSKLQLYLGNNTYNLFTHSIQRVGDFLQDLDVNNIVIVPDKLSLKTEQSIFEILNIDAYFNLEVMGITKFVGKVLKGAGLDMVSYSAQESKLLVHRAIKNVCENFVCFSKKYSLGFVDEIFAKVQQLKSSRVKIEDLWDENASIGTKLKFKDLQLIYTEYERLRNDIPDANEMLEVFNDISGQSDFLKNSNVFFVGFDALTKQGLQILKNVANSAKYCQISITAPKGQDNFRIYDSTFLDSVLSLCKQSGIECESEWVDTSFKNADKNFILNNLFSRKNHKNSESEYFSIINSGTMADEIENCTNAINYIIKTKNVRFNKIAICADMSYHQILKAKLKLAGIDAFADKKLTLSEFEPVKYLLNILKFSVFKNLKNLKYIILSDFCDLEKSEKATAVNLLDKFGTPQSVLKFCNNCPESITQFFDDLKEYNLSPKCSLENFVKFTENILKNEKIYEKILKKADFFENNGEIYLQKSFLQLGDKMQKCLTTLSSIFDQSEIFDGWLEMLEKLFDSTQVLSVPSSVNQVFIGDATCFYYGVDYLFVLGLNQGLMPSMVLDQGLILDKEIVSPTIKAQIEPITKVVNKRNKFKLFEILLSANEKVFVSYHNFNSAGKSVHSSEIVSELEGLFENKNIFSGNFKFLTDKSDASKFNFNLVSGTLANLKLAGGFDAGTKAIIQKALNVAGMLKTPKQKNEQPFNYSKLFFKNNRASISIIEAYCACPQMAFISKALKLKNKERNSAGANIIGTFIHEVAQKFADLHLENLGSLCDSEIHSSVQKIIESIKDKDDYFALILPENEYLLKMICAECERFCEFINSQQSASKFKICSSEKAFGRLGGLKPIELEIGGEKYTITGVIDRIDEDDDAFCIVDYKTGNTTNASGAQHLFYGSKIQLFVYARAVQESLGKQLFGAFYLPIRNNFTASGQEPYALSGFYENDSYYAMRLDQNLSPDSPKSKTFGAKLNKAGKDGSLSLYNGRNVLSKEQLFSYCDYAIEMVKMAISEVALGHTAPSPLAGKCEICSFNKICRFAFREEIVRETNYDIKKETFTEILN